MFAQSPKFGAKVFSPNILRPSAKLRTEGEVEICKLEDLHPDLAGVEEGARVGRGDVLLARPDDRLRVDGAPALHQVRGRRACVE